MLPPAVPPPAAAPSTLKLSKPLRATAPPAAEADALAQRTVASSTKLAAVSAGRRSWPCRSTPSAVNLQRYP